MSLPVRVSTKFTRKSVPVKVIDGKAIIEGLSSLGTLLPDLPVPITDLETVNTELQAADIAASTGDKTAIVTCRMIEAEWIAKFKETADYVGLKAKGDTTVICKAGFTPTKGEQKKATLPAMVNNVKVAPGRGKGTCKVAFDGPAGIKGRVIVAVPEEVTATLVANTVELEWGGKKIYIHATSRRAAELVNLTSRQTLCISVLGFNSAGCSPLTHGIEVTPQ